MFHPNEQEIQTLKEQYEEDALWLPSEDPEGYLLKQRVNDFGYQALKGRLPEALITIFQDSNIYRWDDVHALGALSHLLAGYVQITEDKIKELEDRLSKLENQSSVRM
jgi:hypothetical protein